MKSYPYVPSMVHAITVLTVLKMMTKGTAPLGTPVLVLMRIFQPKPLAARGR
jgi:hypothetical protein